MFMHRSDLSCCFLSMVREPMADCRAVHTPLAAIRQKQSLNMAVYG